MLQSSHIVHMRSTSSLLEVVKVTFFLLILVRSSGQPNPPCQLSTQRLFTVFYVGNHTELAGNFNDEFNASAVVEIFDPNNNTWNFLPNTPQAVFGYTSGVISQRVHVYGGLGNDTIQLRCLHMYDIVLTT